MKTKIMGLLAPVFLMAACMKTQPVDYQSLAWINNFYMERPASNLSALARGWLFRGAKDVRGDVNVSFVVTEPFDVKRDKRRTVLKSLCPSRYEAIWKLLDSRHDIVISIRTQDSKLRDWVTCNRA